MKSAKIPALLALTLFASPCAVAADFWPYGYIGGSVGRSKAKFDEAGIAAGLIGAGFTSAAIASDDTDIGYKLYGGYRFSRYFALEGGYFNLGEYSFTATTVPPGALSGSFKVRGANLDAVGIIPITDRFSAFGRAGVTYHKSRGSFIGSGAVLVLNPTPEESDPGYKLGVGLQYDFGEHLGFRAEFERYRVSDSIGGKGDVDLVTVGLVYRFGAKTPAPAPRAAEPVRQPVYTAPPPAPVVREAPPPQVIVTPPPPPPPAEKPIRKDRN